MVRFRTLIAEICCCYFCCYWFVVFVFIVVVVVPVLCMYISCPTYNTPMYFIKPDPNPAPCLINDDFDGNLGTMLLFYSRNLPLKLVKIGSVIDDCFCYCFFCSPCCCCYFSLLHFTFYIFFRPKFFITNFFRNQNVFVPNEFSDQKYFWHFKPSLVKISPKLNTFDLSLVFNWNLFEICFLVPKFLRQNLTKPTKAKKKWIKQTIQTKLSIPIENI